MRWLCKRPLTGVSAHETTGAPAKQAAKRRLLVRVAERRIIELVAAKAETAHAPAAHVRGERVIRALLAVSAGVVLFLERAGQAGQIGAGVTIPSIELNPAIGQPGSVVAVQGQAWQTGRTVLVYLLGRQETVPDYAVASAVVDPQGRFETTFVVPTDPRWQSEATITVVIEAIRRKIVAFKKGSPDLL